MISSHKEHFDQLAARIREVVGDKWFYFLPNSGNWGDSLIREGAERFFDYYGFRYQMIKTGNEFSRNFFRQPKNLRLFVQRHLFQRPLVFGGSGAYCEHYHKEVMVLKLANYFPKTVVLPSTFQYSCPFDENFIVFSRDKFQSKTTMPTADFCHDMAFFLGKMERTATEEVGHFFRTDKESRNPVELPKDNYDLSRYGDEHSDVEEFFDLVGKYAVIHTDRLHIGIAAGLLGREVHLYTNSYFKCEAIYNSSMQGVFDNVRLIKG